VKTTPARIPSATYRLQFNASLRLADARQLVGYLADLGISDVYASPLFRARESSAHGYDVVDHGTIDPAIGTQADFQSFAEELREQGLGLMMDVVPNHMGIDDPHNLWWQDVLENGPSSPYAKYFDIDWSPPKASLKDKVLLPFLGDQYGKVLENQELQLTYDGERLAIAYYDRRFPVAPRSWLVILRLVLEQVQGILTAEHADRMELESIMTALENLPLQTEREAARVQQRLREKEVVRRRLAALYAAGGPIHDALDRAVAEINGRRGEPHSFDRLEQLLGEQAYRLSYWRVASDEINYRRFFDINALAAIRVEDPEVFHAVHAMIFEFLKRGWVGALRIDHPDGLLDPQQYFTDLQRCYAEAVSAVAERPNDASPPTLYLAVEKILARDEQLPPDWPVCGTTGYDFLNLLNGLFLDPRGIGHLREVYSRFTDHATAFADVLYQSKQTILSYSMASELYVLASQLVRISEQHRWSRDFTRSAIHRALREVIACFPVYRTYVRPSTQQVTLEDRRRILVAIRTAKRRNPQMSPAYFDFIAAVLLLEHPDGLSEEDRQQRLQFVQKFQQVTGPVMAKGLEDTAFYRWYPLASLNDVGGDPTLAGTSLEQFHRHNAQRLSAWPHTMLGTATHDTKRGEDVRARLNVLSEVPQPWRDAIGRWQGWNEPHRGEIDGAPVPDRNEEYLLYQTLVGTWPREPSLSQQQDYVERIVHYMDKALKEAKLHTSWANPYEEYDRMVADFVRAILDRTKAPSFLRDLDAFVRSVADAGWINSLGQCVAKMCAPGCPDFYQGTELWDFHLVDPDNRGRVDFTRRRELLDQLQRCAERDLSALAAELLAVWPDERIKLFVMWRALRFRRERRELFTHGDYTAVPAEGPRGEHVCAFARQQGGSWALAIVPRLVAPLFRGESTAAEGVTPTTVLSAAAAATNDRVPPLFGPDGRFACWWRGTSLQLPSQAPTIWHHEIVGAQYAATMSSTGATLDLAQLFGDFPVAILEAREPI
jgi:(1->4)-alpha-D-glucan 1-alpha-D-glucosylmutase